MLDNIVKLFDYYFVDLNIDISFSKESRAMNFNFMRLMTVVTVVASLSMFSAGCTKKTVRTDKDGTGAISQNGKQGGEAIGSEESLSAGSSANMADSAYSEGRTSMELLPVYFDFDKSNIRSDQKGRIEGNAYYMKNHPGAIVRIEGNCDERGTNEYNMALGERRAMSSKKYLINLGVPESRMQTVSYGEEKPLLYGHDELSWAQNRRDDFVILK